MALYMLMAGRANSTLFVSCPDTHKHRLALACDEHEEQRFRLSSARFVIIMVFESVISNLLNTYLNEFIDDLSANQLKIGVFSG